MNQIWVYVFGFVIGAILGSFAKATADRSIQDITFGKRSYCKECNTVLSWYDLFPVFSFLFLKGRCRYCGRPIAGGLFLAEIGMGTLIAVLFGQNLDLLLSLTVSFQLTQITLVLNLLFKIFALTVMTILFFTDLETGYIPNRITYPASFISMVYLFVISIIQSVILYVQIQQNELGKYLLPPYTNYYFVHLLRIWQPATWAAFSALIVSLLFTLLIVMTRGRGMGWGDVKYVFFLGLVLGFPNILLALFLSFFFGAVFSIGLILAGKKHFGQTVPFGPFLSIGSMTALLWGSQIIDWYLQLSV
jgi:leader peptidase (prepilin peptidase) / N-methyltransferase